MVSERIQRQIDSLDEAEQALKTHDWDIVRARAESVLAFDPDNVDAAAFIAAAGRAQASTPSPTQSMSEPLNTM